MAMSLSNGLEVWPPWKANVSRGTRPRQVPLAQDESDPAQQPATHFPPASNSIVLPDSGRTTGTLDAFRNASVFEPARTLPPCVPASLACEGMTVLGLTRSLMT